MNVARRNAAIGSLLLVFTVFSLILVGCESPGSVGGSFTDPGTEVRDTVFSVSGIENNQYVSFTGNLSNISAGEFDDPLFGTVRAVSLLKPSLPSIGVTDSLSSSASLSLQLSVNDSSMYGDTLSTAQFDIVEIGEIWRGRSWQINDEPVLTQNVIGSFEVDNEADSLVVPLSQEWSSRYRAFYNAISANRDSLYRYDFHGLALVPTNSSKVVPFSPSNSRFFVIDPAQEDTSFVTGSQWAYSVERSGGTDAPDGTSKLLNTFEEVLRFELKLSREDLGTVNISKVELLIYQNDEVLESTLDQASGSAVRPPLGSADLFLSTAEDLPDVFTAGTPLTNGIYDAEEGAYRFDITRFTNSVLVEGVPDDNSFYVTLDDNDGIVKSSLIFNENGPEGKRPKLIVTYVQTKDS